jgi:endoribonuclease Dicer
MYWGDMGVDFWDGAIWKEEMEKHEVRVFAFQWQLEYVIVILYQY